MTKIYRVMYGSDWHYVPTIDEAKALCGGGGGLYGTVYECRLIAPRTKKTVVDAANQRFDEVVQVWPPAVQ